MDPNSLTPVRYQIVSSRTPVYERDHIHIYMGEDLGDILPERPPEGGTPYFSTPETRFWFKCEQVTEE